MGYIKQYSPNIRDWRGDPICFLTISSSTDVRELSAERGAILMPTDHPLLIPPLVDSTPYGTAASTTRLGLSSYKRRNRGMKSLYLDLVLIEEKLE
jgi:hypothetical protein